MPDALTVARRHVATLAAFALLSLVAAAGAWTAARGPDGRDPFYMAMAIQCLVWGVIDLGFAVRGLLVFTRISRRDRDTTERMRTRTLAALRVSNGLNVLYLIIGTTLALAGYRLWSAALVGHGLGVLLQAIPLVLIDVSFSRGLRRPGHLVST